MYYTIKKQYSIQLMNEGIIQMLGKSCLKGLVYVIWNRENWRLGMKTKCQYNIKRKKGLVIIHHVIKPGCVGFETIALII